MLLLSLSLSFVLTAYDAILPFFRPFSRPFFRPRRLFRNEVTSDDRVNLPLEISYTEQQDDAARGPHSKGERILQPETYCSIVLQNIAAYRSKRESRYDVELDPAVRSRLGFQGRCSCRLMSLAEALF